MDRYWLTGGGTTLDIGSWLIAEKGPDFDFAAVRNSRYAQNALSDQPAFMYETSGVRKFRFPIRLASNSAWTNTEVLAGMFRELARPGAVIDLFPEGTPSGEAVRFDVLNGRLVDEYNVYLQRLDRREASLELDVKPYGYWPTQIRLASFGGASFPVSATWNPASIIGDAPPLVRLVVQPSAGGFSFFGRKLDGLAWSMARGNGSIGAMPPFRSASWFWIASTGLVNTGTYYSASLNTSDALSPGGNSRSFMMSPTLNAGVWNPMLKLTENDIPDARGRWRVFGYFRTQPSMSQTVALQVAADVIGYQGVYKPLASAGPVATIIPPGASVYENAFAPASAYQIVDLGEMSIPPGASGMGDQWTLRIWGKPGATTNIGSPSFAVYFGGVYMLRVDGPAGIIGNGLAVPSYGALNSAVVQAVVFDSISGPRVVVNNLGPTGGYVGDLAFAHRGPMPYLTPTSNSLDLLTFWREGSATGATVGRYHGAAPILDAWVEYRPRFTFAKGI